MINTSAKAFFMHSKTIGFSFGLFSDNPSSVIATISTKSRQLIIIAR